MCYFGRGTLGPASAATGIFIKGTEYSANQFGQITIKADQVPHPVPTAWCNVVSSAAMLSASSVLLVLTMIS